MMPMAFRGLGAHLRRVRYGWDDFGDSGYSDYTDDDMRKWNNLAVAFVS